MRNKLEIIGSIITASILLFPAVASASLTLSGTAVTSDAGLTLNGAAGSAITLGSANVAGTLTLGGTTQTGDVLIGQSTQNNYVKIGSGVPASGKVTVVEIAKSDAVDGSNYSVEIASGQGSTTGVTRTVNIATGGYADVAIGNTQTSSSMLISAGAGSTLWLNASSTAQLWLGGASQTGTIKLGFSTGTNTISIGSANTSNGNIQTINIGAGTPAGFPGGKAVITIGNTGNNSTSVAIRAGKSSGAGILLEGGLNYGIAADGDDDYDIFISPAPSFPNGIPVGTIIIFVVLTANTGSATINVNGIGPVALVKGNDAALATNDIIGGRTYIAVFDGAYWDLINPATQ